MLTYSQWRPDGGYDYFAAEQTAPLGNDLPQPPLAVVNNIGVPSVEAGRAIPSGASYAGSGELPVGVIAPMDRSRIGGLTPLSGIDWFAFFAGAAAVGVVWLVWGRDKK